MQLEVEARNRTDALTNLTSISRFDASVSALGLSFACGCSAKFRSKKMPKMLWQYDGELQLLRGLMTSEIDVALGSATAVRYDRLRWINHAC